jgi:hypothetical protein
MNPLLLKIPPVQLIPENSPTWEIITGIGPFALTLKPRCQSNIQSVARSSGFPSIRSFVRLAKPEGWRQDKYSST